MRKMCKVLSMAMILSTIAGTGAISMSVPSLKVDAATTTASQTNVNASVTASGGSFKDVNGNEYQVLNGTTKTVAFYRVNTNADKNSTLVIPQTINVTENGTKVKYTVTEIIKNLKEIKFFKSSEGYMPAYTRTEFTDVLHDVFGTRTDYEIIPFSDMKKIFSYSKKSFTYHVSK